MTYELNVLVHGKRVKHYQHNGKVYIEGRKGSDYCLEVKNNTKYKCLAVLSVDGLSIMDGKPADAKTSGGYILAPHTSMRIPGWRLDNANVAKFTFGDRKSAYATSKGKKAARNIGVIGCAVYREIGDDYVPPVYVPVTPWYPYIIPLVFGTSDSTLVFGTSDSNTTSHEVRLNNASATITSSDVPTMTFSEASGSNDFVAYAQDLPGERHAYKAGEPGTLNVGTEFGDRAGHATVHTVFFRKSDPEMTMTITYSDRVGLEKMGVDLSQSTKRRYESPSPFPGSDCQPPAGWRG